MRSLKLLILIILLYSPVNANMKNAFDFKFNSIDSEEISLSKYKGKTILIVNVASKCGFTNQYKGLQTLWDEYKNKDFVVIGVSSNDFNQELPNKEDVKKFCEVNFGINFPMTDITNVKGENAHPFFKWANVTTGFKPKWNFYKILINKSGQIEDTFGSLTKPNSTKLISAIEKIL